MNVAGGPRTVSLEGREARAGASRPWVRRLEQTVGGPERLRAVALFAAVLALESADLGTIGAVAPSLEHSFGIDHTQLGLLASISLLVSALATLPFGVLADRANRVKMLWGTVGLWAAAMIVVGSSDSFETMMFARLGLGFVMAAAGPALASLTGDIFDPKMRGKVFGLIGAGELAGTAFGYMVSGSIAAATSWRFAFWALAPPAILLSWALRRYLREPRRRRQGSRADSAPDDGARHAVRAAAVEPDAARILGPEVDVERMPLTRAVRYVLTVRTNLTLIAASAIGYFFFAGLRTFAVTFLRRHYDVSQAGATALVPVFGIGALAGVLIGGRVADRLLARGRLNARVTVPAIAYVTAAVLLVPGLLVGSLLVAMIFYAFAAAALSAANPPLDSARLDIVPSGLWGRAESARTFLRELAQAGAPLLFGLTADAFGGHGGGLQHAFLIMLVPLALSAGIVWRGRRTYQRDVATAVASEEG